MTKAKELLQKALRSHHIFVHPDVPELVNLQDVNSGPSLIMFDSS